MPEQPSEQPIATVAVFIDYKAGGRDAFNNLRLTLEGLAGQDFREPVEFLMVETTQDDPVPDEVRNILPALRVVRCNGTTSYDLKNASAEAASTDFVVLLDADCVPQPGWWRALIEHRKRHPEAAAISGKTVYRAEGLLPRILALLDRSYVDAGEHATTQAISNNNGAIRRDVLLKFPLQNDLGPFGSKIHAEQIRAAGGELRFEPGMVVAHRYGGWPMIRADRRQIGFAMTRYRQINKDADHGWMFRLGKAGMPIVLAMAVAGSWKRCLKHGRRYGVRWFEMPAAMATAVAAHAMEVPGILLALRGGRIEATGSYR